ncbi:unnamed protein product [Haemonchus placei]|uniref:Cytochrome b5 heme-binding domain-containing protein n=1 Tax=Haemonchus placei TaxID=6290 RepID=A0A0N4WJ62_HAEPC|nr:unnamed protein product [Haemonchus placei]
MLHVNHSREHHWVALGGKPPLEPKTDLMRKYSFADVEDIQVEK